MRSLGKRIWAWLNRPAPEGYNINPTPKNFKLPCPPPPPPPRRECGCDGGFVVTNTVVVVCECKKPPCPFCNNTGYLLDGTTADLCYCQ